MIVFGENMYNGHMLTASHLKVIVDAGYTVFYGDKVLLRKNGAYYEMQSRTNNSTGAHMLSCDSTDTARLFAHWLGYVERQRYEASELAGLGAQFLPRRIHE